MKTYTKKDKIIIELEFQNEINNLSEDVLASAWMVYSKVGETYSLLVRGGGDNKQRTFFSDEMLYPQYNEDTFNRILQYDLDRSEVLPDFPEISYADAAIKSLFERLVIEYPPQVGASKYDYARHICELQDQAAIEVYYPDDPPFRSQTQVLDDTLARLYEEKVSSIKWGIKPKRDDEILLAELSSVEFAPCEYPQKFSDCKPSQN